MSVEDTAPASPAEIVIGLTRIGIIFGNVNSRFYAAIGLACLMRKWL